MRKITRIRRRSRSIDSALGETPALFPAREEQNTVLSSPLRKDKLPSFSTVRHSCSGSGADGGGGGGDGDTRDKEIVVVGGDWRRAGVRSAVSGDVRSFVLVGIESNNF